MLLIPVNPETEVKDCDALFPPFNPPWRKFRSSAGPDPKRTLPHTQSPLVSLPPELLVEVCLHITNRDVARFEYWLELLKFAHVCRYWRAVALEAPILWSVIRLESTNDLDTSKAALSYPGMIREALKRSRHSLLSLLVRYTGHDLVDYKPVIPELHRLETLLCFYKGSPPPTSILADRDFDAPQLRQLFIQNTKYGSEHIHIPLISPESSLEYLESVRTAGIRYEHVSPYFRHSLKQLSIRSPGNRNSVEFIAEFLYALNDMPLLEDLEIQYLLSGQDVPIDAPTLPSVTLPFLRKITCYEMLLPLTEFMEHLTYPAAVLLNGINSLRLILADPWVDRGADRVYLHMRLWNSLVSKITNESGESPVRFNELLIRASEGTSPSVDLNNCGSDFAVCDKFAYGVFPPRIRPIQALDIVVQTFPYSILSTITTLHLGVYDYQDEDWSPTFMSAFHGLECLELQRMPGVWRGLAQVHQDISSSHGILHFASTLPFPNLRSLEIKRAIFRDQPSSDGVDSGDFIWALRDLLRIRADAGMRLEELSIFKGINFTQRDVEMLEMYVGHVSWDHIVRLGEKEELDGLDSHSELNDLDSDEDGDGDHGSDGSNLEMGLDDQ